MQLRFSLLPGDYAVVRLGPHEPLPAWADGGDFTSITRTAGELSVICREAAVPRDVVAERGWRCFRVEGPIAFDAIGIAAAITSPLAAAGISVLLVATHDTDYFLVAGQARERAVARLRAEGHLVQA